jgi:hypothetical protein
MCILVFLVRKRDYYQYIISRWCGIPFVMCQCVW